MIHVQDEWANDFNSQTNVQIKASISGHMGYMQLWATKFSSFVSGILARQSGFPG